MPTGPRVIPVYVVVPPPPLLLDIVGPLEVLRRANHEQAGVRFDVRYVGATATLNSSIGLALHGVEPLPAALPGDALIIVPGSASFVMGDMGETPSAADIDQETTLVGWLAARVGPGQRLVTIGTGALLAARAGLFDGYACTTHHAYTAELARLAPTARVLENRLYVEDGDRMSSAGLTAGVDLMLHLVAQLVDPTCAVNVARYMVVYLRRDGGDPQLSPWLEGRDHIHPAVHRVQDAVAADPGRAWTLGALASLAGVSERQLSRLFRDHAQMSVAHYVSRVRVALADELLGNTRLGMEHVAERAGFGSARQLRRTWRRFHPTPPRGARGAREPADGDVLGDE